MPRTPKPTSNRPSKPLASWRALISGDQNGATAIEYALMAAAIGAAVAAAVYALGTKTQGLYAGIAAQL